MYICICNKIADSQIKDCVAQGASSLTDLREMMSIANQCCKCVPDTHSIIETAVAEREQSTFNVDAVQYYTA